MTEKRTRITVALLAAVGLMVQNADRWWPQWVGVATVMVLVSMYSIAKAGYPKLISVCFGYFAFNALYSAFWRNNQFNNGLWGHDDQFLFRLNAAEFFIYLLSFRLLAGWVGNFCSLTQLFRGLYFAVMLTTVGTIAVFHQPYGWLGNFGMNASTAIILSCAMSPLWLIPAALLAIYSGASTPLLVLGVVVWRRFKLPTVWFLFAGALLLAALHMWAPQYLDDSARFKNWIMYWGWMKEHYLWLGNGAGSFKAIGPWLQQVHGETHEYLIWAHNEYLQVAFEFGVVGLVLLLASVGQMLWSNRRRRVVTEMMAGFLACGITDFPLRLALPAFIAFLLMYKSAGYKEYGT